MAKIIKMTCPQCNGKGTKVYNSKRGLETCRYCSGKGQVETVDQSK